MRRSSAAAKARAQRRSSISGSPSASRSGARRGVRTHRYTLMISKMPGEPTETVLHDNLEDPYQLENIAGENPDVVERLVREELTPWLARTADPWRR